MEWYKTHKEHALARMKVYRQTHPQAQKYKDYKKWHHLMATYGITPEKYAELLEAQKGLCAICGKAKRLVVDHDHKTGEIRGLLCRICNGFLGLFENKELLRRMELYESARTK